MSGAWYCWNCWYCCVSRCGFDLLFFVRFTCLLGGGSSSEEDESSELSDVSESCSESSSTVGGCKSILECVVFDVMECNSKRPFLIDVDGACVSHVLGIVHNYGTLCRGSLVIYGKFPHRRFCRFCRRACMSICILWSHGSPGKSSVTCGWRRCVLRKVLKCCYRIRLLGEVILSPRFS